MNEHSKAMIHSYEGYIVQVGRETDDGIVYEDYPGISPCFGQRVAEHEIEHLITNGAVCPHWQVVKRTIAVTDKIVSRRPIPEIDPRAESFEYTGRRWDGYEMEVLAFLYGRLSCKAEEFYTRFPSLATYEHLHDGGYIASKDAKYFLAPRGLVLLTYWRSGAWKESE